MKLKTKKKARLHNLLKKNYDELTSKECAKKTIKFIKRHKSIEKEDDEFFIKKLTKVGQHVIENKELKKLVKNKEKIFERLYEFNITGADKTHDQKMKSHFYSHASSIARLLYKETRNLEWFIKSINSTKKSINIALNHDLKHAAYSYNILADKLLTMHTITNDNQWLIKSTIARINCGELMTKYDKRIALECYESIRRTCLVLQHTQEEDWLSISYPFALEAIKLIKPKKKKALAMAYKKAAIISFKLYQKKGLEEYLIDNEEQLTKASELFKNFNLKQYSNSVNLLNANLSNNYDKTNNLEKIEKKLKICETAGKLLENEIIEQSINHYKSALHSLKILIKKTNRVRYFKKKIALNEKVGSILESINKLDAALQYQFASNDALELYQRTSDNFPERKSFLDKALKNGEKSIKIFKELENDEEIFYTTRRLARINEKLYKQDQETKYLETALEQQFTCLDLMTEDKRDYEYNLRYNACNTALKLSTIKQDPILGKKAISLINQLINLNEHRHSIEQLHAIKGQCYQNLYNLTNNKQYARNAIKVYNAVTDRLKKGNPLYKEVDENLNQLLKTMIIKN